MIRLTEYKQGNETSRLIKYALNITTNKLQILEQTKGTLYQELCIYSARLRMQKA